MTKQSWAAKFLKAIPTINIYMGYILTLASIVTLVLAFLGWGFGGVFQNMYTFIQENLIPLWLIILTFMLLINIASISRLTKKLFFVFTDKFNNLENWDYKGEWRVTEPGTILITGSDEGGITKIGSNWENYTIQFQARIISECLGVIVRAKDLYNYHMFQIRPDMIRPHYKTVNTLTHEVRGANREITGYQISYVYQWQNNRTSDGPEFASVPINPQLNSWFDVKIIVNGASVQIYINNDLVLDQPSSLKIPAGKIGFRNSQNTEGVVEVALVRNLTVKLM